MKYEVKYSCGHDGVLDLGGRGRDREWKLRNAEKGVCPDCWKAEKQKAREEEQGKRDEENARAKERAEEMGLPELTGTPKQVAWATTLRDKRIEELRQRIEVILEKKPSLTFAESLGKLHQDKLGEIPEDTTFLEVLEKTLDFIIRERTSASYYIDYRLFPISQIILKECHNAIK